MKEKVVSFIPIKLNNDRLPGKNLMPLNGRPLCDYVFDTICRVDGVDERYVYCSDKTIEEYIRPHAGKGLRFLRRDTVLDRSETKGLEIIRAFVEVVDAEVYVLSHVTQPFSKPETIEVGLRKVLDEGYDSAFSAVKLQDYMWMDGKPLNYDPQDIVRTQDMNPIYMETGAFFIFRREVFKKQGRLIGEKPYICEVGQFEAIDIDTKEEFDFACAVAEFLSKAGNMDLQKGKRR